MGAIEQHRDTARVGHRNHFGGGVDGAERIGDMNKGEQPGPLAQQLLHRMKIQFSGGRDRDDLKKSAGLLREYLPGDNVGVVLHGSNQDFVTRPDAAPTKALGDQIDGLRGSPNKDDFMIVAGIDELPDLAAGRLIAVSGPLAERVNPSMDIRIVVFVYIANGVDHGAWFLSGCAVIQVVERMPVDGLGQDRKITPDGLYIQRLVQSAGCVHSGCGSRW